MDDVLRSKAAHFLQKHLFVDLKSKILSKVRKFSALGQQLI
jgi:hypothetical protein